MSQLLKSSVNYSNIYKLDPCICGINWRMSSKLTTAGGLNRVNKVKNKLKERRRASTSFTGVGVVGGIREPPYP